jgi:hypothetical protein
LTFVSTGRLSLALGLIALLALVVLWLLGGA